MGNNRNITKSLSIKSKNIIVSNLLNSVNDSQFSKGSYRDKFRIIQNQYLILYEQNFHMILINKLI